VTGAAGSTERGYEYRSASGNPAAGAPWLPAAVTYLPAAVQAVADVHDTPLRAAERPGLGVAWIVQVVPLRPVDLAQPQARLAIEKLAGDLEVAGVSCGFFDHVQNHPAHGGDLGIDLGIAVPALRSV